LEEFPEESIVREGRAIFQFDVFQKGEIRGGCVASALTQLVVVRFVSECLTGTPPCAPQKSLVGKE